MNKEQQQVRDWMTRFGQAVESKPTIPSLEIRKLRAKLILEEALETINALGFYVAAYGNKQLQCYELDSPASLASIADGIADSLVVLLGTTVACGIDIKPIFDEVMRSNYSKLWSDDDLMQKFHSGMDEADKAGYIVTLVVTHPEVDESVWLVKDSSGKIIKPPSHSPPAIAPILEAQQ